jgi:hypothetical protein
MNVRRGEIIGQPVDHPPEHEAEHFIRCPACEGWIDMRDLAHPAQDGIDEAPAQPLVGTG